MPRSIPLAILTALLAVPSAPAADPTDGATALQERMKELIAKTETSVVSLVISTNPKHLVANPTRPWELGDYPSQNLRRQAGRQPVRDRLDLSDPRNAGDYVLGSGVVLDAENGLILTCYHLIDGARRVYVRGAGAAGSYADIMAGDARSDLLVLQLRDRQTKLTAAKLADVRTYKTEKQRPTVTRGQFVVSVAHPFAAGFADGKASASWGILSNVDRKVSSSGSVEESPAYLQQYGTLLQSDARLNLGCSGGGLFNLDGELIGLTSSAAGVAGSDAAGGYAVPMDRIYRGIIDVLKTGEEVEYGFLGVTPGPMSGDLKRPGLVVDRVSPGSPAELAGLKAGEIIQAVNGRPVVEDTDLFLLVGGTLANRTVTLTVLGDDLPREIKPTLAKFQQPFPTIASVRPDPVYGLRVEYSSILAQQGGGPGIRPRTNWNGVLVHELEPKSRAEAVFKENGIGTGRWLVTKVNDKAVRTPAAFYAAAKNAQTVRLALSDTTTSETKVVTLP